MQGRAHALQVLQLRLDLVKPLGGDGPDSGAVFTILERQQAGDLVEREAEFLGALDEADAIDQIDRVAAIATVPVRHRQQVSSLVVAHRFDADAGAPGEMSDGQGGFERWVHGGHSRGIRLTLGAGTECIVELSPMHTNKEIP